VEELQTKLNLIPSAAGDAFLSVDGGFGGATETAVKAFQHTRMGLATPPGIVGNGTWAALDSTLVGIENAPRVHPVLHLGDKSAAVGEAQEKLNAAGAAAVMPVDGVFSAAMQTAVRNFQHTRMAIAAPSGVVDLPTWTALDNAAPGGGTRAARGGNVIEEHVAVPGGGHATVPADSSLHPIVGPGNVTTGLAVKEMQQKLNGFLASKGQAYMTAHGVRRLSDDGTWGPKTLAVLQVFQAEAPAVPQTGLCDVATWSKLDAFHSTVGFETRTWHEMVGGHRYGMTSVYSWQLSPTMLLVTVGINFVPPSNGQPMPAVPAATWFGNIKATWNRFKAVKTGDPTKSVLISFNPVQSTQASARRVEVMPGAGRSDAGHWFVVDANIAQTVSHEFGHMVGLRDEYQQVAADYRSTVGYETPVGAITGPAGKTPIQVAQQLRNAMVARANPSVSPSAAAQATAGMQQGAFAQQVIAAYATLPSVNVPAQARVPAAPPNLGVAAAAAFATNPRDLVGDLDKGLNNFDGGSIPNDKYQTIEVLTYDSGAIMGDDSRQPDQHEHGAQPRHVREFSDIVATARGAAWEPGPR
jgi:peptidoglycan hydrolase-like protein with peptidoglycan-binding domain